MVLKIKEEKEREKEKKRHRMKIARNDINAKGDKIQSTGSTAAGRNKEKTGINADRDL